MKNVKSMCSWVLAIFLIQLIELAKKWNQKDFCEIWTLNLEMIGQLS